MPREKVFKEDKFNNLLEQESEQTLEQRHVELANGLALVVDAVQSIQPQSIDLSPVIGELKSVAKTIEATQNDDVNIILSHLDKHFATIGKKLDAIEIALRPRYESIDIIRNNQGLQTQFKLNPIKGN